MRALVVAGSLLALAAAPPTPEAAAPADVCVPSCTIVGAMNAFTPGAVGLTSGSTVTWTSPTIEELHSATGTDGTRGCLHLTLNAGDSKSAAFLVEADGLYGQVAGREAIRCAAAEEVADGVFQFDYICLYHPPMVGTLYVLASA